MSDAEAITVALRQMEKVVGLRFPPSAEETLARYLALLQQWNTTVRLTSSTEMAELINRHLADSLVGAGLLPQKARVLDIGSGAGFPALPLAVVRPDLRWVLAESRERRAAFLQEARRVLNLENVEVRHARLAGDPHTEGLPDPFDRITCRAVAADTILAFAHAYLRPGGRILYWGTCPTVPLPPPEPATSPLYCLDTFPYTLPSQEQFQIYIYYKSP